MNTYYNYLEESTNVVKSNTKRNKTVTILSYLMIWTVSMLVFWVFKGGIDAMGYSLMFLWIIIPVTTFTVSVIIGKNNFWGIKKWAFTFPFGVMYMEWDLAVAGAIISAIGMLTGLLINWICRNRNKIA